MKIKAAIQSVSTWVNQTFTLKGEGPLSILGIGPNWSGEMVTPEKVMQLSAVMRAVRLSAETMATMPLNFYKDDGTGPQLARGSDADRVCRVSPNMDQTPVEFWEQILACAELLGNGYAEKQFVGPRLVSMVVLNPQRMRPFRRDGILRYRYTDQNGRLRIYEVDEIFHLRGFSMGGDSGISTVAAGAQTFGLAIAAERAAGTLFKSGLRSSGFLTTDSVFKEGDRETIQKTLDQYVGSENAGSIMVLEAGMKFEPITMSAADAELLMTRKYEIEDIGRWFGMPPILLGHAVEGQTMWGSGVETIIQSWLTLGLNQRIKRVEAAIKKRIVSARDGDIYPKYNVDALLRANSEARARLISTHAQNGTRTRNELRALDELPPMAGGDELTAQVNLVPLRLLGQNTGSTPEAQAKAALRAWLEIEDKTSEDDNH